METKNSFVLNFELFLANLNKFFLRLITNFYVVLIELSETGYINTIKCTDNFQISVWRGA
jgi:hypothetical protein